MYPDKSNKKAHLIDFTSVLSRLEKETTTTERNYRIKILKECIRKCSE